MVTFPAVGAVVCGNVVEKLGVVVERLGGGDHLVRAGHAGRGAEGVQPGWRTGRGALGEPGAGTLSVSVEAVRPARFSLVFTGA